VIVKGKPDFVLIGVGVHPFGPDIRKLKGYTLCQRVPLKSLAIRPGVIIPEINIWIPDTKTLIGDVVSEDDIYIRYAASTSYKWEPLKRDPIVNVQQHGTSSPEVCPLEHEQHDPLWIQAMHDHECSTCAMPHLTDHVCPPCDLSHLKDHNCVKCDLEHVAGNANVMSVASHEEIIKSAQETAHNQLVTTMTTANREIAKWSTLAKEAQKATTCVRNHLDDHICKGCAKDHLDDHICAVCPLDHLTEEHRTLLTSQLSPCQLAHVEESAHNELESNLLAEVAQLKENLRLCREERDGLIRLNSILKREAENKPPASKNIYGQEVQVIRSTSEEADAKIAWLNTVVANQKEQLLTMTATGKECVRTHTTLSPVELNNLLAHKCPVSVSSFEQLETNLRKAQEELSSTKSQANRQMATLHTAAATATTEANALRDKIAEQLVKLNQAKQMAKEFSDLAITHDKCEDEILALRGGMEMWRDKAQHILDEHVCVGCDEPHLKDHTCAKMTPAGVKEYQELEDKLQLVTTLQAERENQLEKSLRARRTAFGRRIADEPLLLTLTLQRWLTAEGTAKYDFTPDGVVDSKWWFKSVIFGVSYSDIVPANTVFDEHTKVMVPTQETHLELSHFLNGEGKIIWVFDLIHPEWSVLTDHSFCDHLILATDENYYLCRDPITGDDTDLFTLEDNLWQNVLGIYMPTPIVKWLNAEMRTLVSGPAESAVGTLTSVKDPKTGRVADCTCRHLFDYVIRPIKFNTPGIPSLRTENWPVTPWMPNPSDFVWDLGAPVMSKRIPCVPVSMLGTTVTQRIGRFIVDIPDVSTHKEVCINTPTWGSYMWVCRALPSVKAFKVDKRERGKRFLMYFAPFDWEDKD
jgi:hypothetical protein